MAVRTIKTRLELAGDREFRDKLKKANAELAEQKSKIKLLNEEYKNAQNSQEALRKKLEQLKEMQGAVNKTLEAAREGLRNATKENEKYDAQVASAKEKIQAAQMELEGLNTATEEGAKRQAELSEEIARYQAELEEAQKRQEAAAAGVDVWATKQAKAKTELNNTSRQIKEYEGYLKEAEESTTGCATSIDEYGKKVKKASEEQEKLNGGLENSGDAIGSLAAALTASGLSSGIREITEVLTECVQQAAEFETALAKVGTIADTEAVSMDTIREGILKLSGETGQAVAELSEATYNAISASVDTAGAVDFVATATKLATGGFTDNTTAVDILTTVLNAYKMESGQAAEVADYLITTQNLGKTTVGELAGAMGKVIPVAAAYDVEMSNLSSAMAILTANGISTAESTTYLKSALNELGDSGSDVSAVLRCETGMSFGELMKKGYSLGDVMEILGKAVDNDKGAFNELWSSSEAGIAALSLLSAGSRKYNEVLAKMRESAGATTRAYEQMMDTAEASHKKLENAFQNLKIAVGGELQEQMKGVYDIGTDLLTWAADFIQKNEWLVPVLEGVTFGLGALAVAVTGATVATKIIIPLWNTFNTIMAANPVGLVVVAIVSLTAALAPLIASLASTTTEVEEQAKAWKDQADALNESLDAYKEQNGKTEEAVSNTRQLVQSLEELSAKEKKSVAEKEAIAAITDQLNEKFPDLNLQYDNLTGSINLTTEELQAMLEAMERQERYNNARSNYSDIYAKQTEGMESLANAQDALAEATERYEKAWNDYLELGGNNWVLLDAVCEAEKEVKACTEAVDELQRAVAESDAALAQMTYDTNLYVIETAAMTEAERKKIEAMLDAAEAKRGSTEAYYAEIEAIAKVAQEYDGYAASAEANMETVMQKIQALEAQYQESYAAAYENISKQIGLFEEMKVESEKSIEDMKKSLDSQVAYMEEYAEDIRLAMEYGVDEGILRQLTDGSAESAAILQEIVDSGEENIAELNEKFAEVKKGKDEFSSAIAELEAYYGEEMEELVRETEEAVKDMAKYDDAYQSAVETCNGYIEGVNAKWGEVISRYAELAKAAQAAYNGNLPAVQQNTAETEKNRDKILVAESQNRKATEIYLNDTGAGKKNNATTVVNNNQTYNISTPVKSTSKVMRETRLEEQYGLAGGF